jgi:hypothetical protein
MNDLDHMSPQELGSLLADLQSELQDVEEERMFVLGQTGLHVSAATVKRYDSEITGLRAKIDEITRAQARKQAG